MLNITTENRLQAQAWNNQKFDIPVKQISPMPNPHDSNDCRMPEYIHKSTHRKPYWLITYTIKNDNINSNVAVFTQEFRSYLDFSFIINLL